MKDGFFLYLDDEFFKVSVGMSQCRDFQIDDLADFQQVCFDGSDFGESDFVWDFRMGQPELLVHFFPCICRADIVDRRRL